MKPRGKKILEITALLVAAGFALLAAGQLASANQTATLTADNVRVFLAGTVQTIDNTTLNVFNTPLFVVVIDTTASQPIVRRNLDFGGNAMTFSTTLLSCNSVFYFERASDNRPINSAIIAPGAGISRDSTGQNFRLTNCNNLPAQAGEVRIENNLVRLVTPNRQVALTNNTTVSLDSTGLEAVVFDSQNFFQRLPLSINNDSFSIGNIPCTGANVRWFYETASGRTPVNTGLLNTGLSIVKTDNGQNFQLTSCSTYNQSYYPYNYNYNNYNPYSNQPCQYSSYYGSYYPSGCQNYNYNQYNQNYYPYNNNYSYYNNNVLPNQQNLVALTNGLIQIFSPFRALQFTNGAALNMNFGQLEAVIFDGQSFLNRIPLTSNNDSFPAAAVPCGANVRWYYETTSRLLVSSASITPGSGVTRDSSGQNFQLTNCSVPGYTYSTYNPTTPYYQPTLYPPAAYTPAIYTPATNTNQGLISASGGVIQLTPALGPSLLLADNTTINPGVTPIDAVVFSPSGSQPSVILPLGSSLTFQRSGLVGDSVWYYQVRATRQPVNSGALQTGACVTRQGTNFNYGC